MFALVLSLLGVGVQAVLLVRRGDSLVRLRNGAGSGLACGSVFALLAVRAPTYLWQRPSESLLMHV